MFVIIFSMFYGQSVVCGFNANADMFAHNQPDHSLTFLWGSFPETEKVSGKR